MPDEPGFSERNLCKDDINVEIITSQINFLLPRIDDFIDLRTTGSLPRSAVQWLKIIENDGDRFID